MNKTKLVLKLMFILFLMMYIILTFKSFNGLIPNLQAYSNLKFIPIMFWLFVILFFINLIIADIGFIKLGAVIGIVTGVFILVFQMVYNTSSFDLITSSKYELIVETIVSPDIGRVKVYKKDSQFFSKFVGSVLVDDDYDYSYEIVGDSFIISMCNLNYCITDEIDLE